MLAILESLTDWVAQAFQDVENLVHLETRVNPFTAFDNREHPRVLGHILGRRWGHVRH